MGGWLVAWFRGHVFFVFLFVFFPFRAQSFGARRSAMQAEGADGVVPVDEQGGGVDHVGPAF